MAKSISHTRKITIYPANDLKEMIFAESAITNASQSDIVSRALREYYSEMAESKLQKIKDKVNTLSTYPKKSAS